MILLGNLLIGVGNLLSSIITIFYFVLIAHAILSWVNPDPNNMIVQFINSACDPLLRHIRRYVPPFGVIDVSVIVALLGLGLIQSVIAESLVSYGYIFKQSAVKTVGL